MRARDKLISVSNIQGCATAAEHFCSITNGGGGGDIIYITRNPLHGELQKIEILSGVVQKIKTSEGVVKKINYLNGELQKIKTLQGVLNKTNNIKGESKCQ